VPYEKGKVLKQFDQVQIQKMEESVRGPAVAVAKQSAGVDGKRPTREVRTTVVADKKRAGPPLPASGGPAVSVDASIGGVDDTADSASARAAPTPTARGTDGPPVPPVPASAASAPSSDPVPRKSAAPSEPTRVALINQSDKKGWTALTYAVFSGKPDTGTQFIE
jgi:hypothetical protein